MSSPKQIQVTESVEELRKIQRKSTPLIAQRIRALIEIKKVAPEGISKRELAGKIGVNHNSIQKWRTLYCQGGLELLCTHSKKGFKPSVFTQEEHKLIEAKISDPLNGLRGYKELLEWVEAEFRKPIKYNTLLKYSIKNFHSKPKVARKSHINKDEDAVASFKKTSDESVRSSARKKRVLSKK